jgi:hypothetical protein
MITEASVVWTVRSITGAMVRATVTAAGSGARVVAAGGGRSGSTGSSVRSMVVNSGW